MNIPRPIVDQTVAAAHHSPSPSVFGTGGPGVELTSFVGRRGELHQIGRLLTMFRVLTLTGVGGVGKTRLAVRAATEMRRAFADGVRFVDFAALRDPSLVQVTLQTAIGHRDVDDTSESTVDDLVRHLRDKCMLIVLDNCEHVLAELAPIVDALLRTCPQLCLLATSRQALRIEGECSLCIACLPLPDEDKAMTATKLVEYDAVRLFVDRATAALPDFQLTADSVETISAICRRLDGLPLAIELAAVRLKAFSLVELLVRLDDRFALLTGGNRAAIPRQQTLRALIGWSYDLSTEDERVMWARLSMFSGSCSLEAIEGVCSDDRLSRSATTHLVVALVDKSLLVRESHDDSVRYYMLQTIRQFGHEHLLSEGEHSLLQTRYITWFADLVERESAGLFGPGQLTAYRKLRLDIQNVCACLDLCVEHPEAGVPGLRMATQLLYYWFMSGYPREGYERLRRLLRMDVWDTADRIRGLTAAAQLAGPVGEVSAGLELLAEARSCLRLDDAELGSAVELVELMLTVMGASDQRSDDVPAVIEQPVSAGAHAEKLARTTTVALHLGVSGAYDDANRLCAHAQSLSEMAGEQWWGSVVRWLRGLLLSRQGMHAQAVEVERESIELLAPFHDGYLTSLPIQVIASALGEQGEYRRAAQLLGAANHLRHNVELVVTRPQTAAVEQAARRGLGDTRFDAAFGEGMALSYEDAVNLALGVNTGTAPIGAEACVVQRCDGPLAAELAALTRREIEIAALVVEGLTNRQIASHLVISVRTAEGHVERILTKLDLRSRTQLAGRYAQLMSTGGS